MQVKGRLLMTPKVVYGRNTQIEAREGKWRAERKTFLKPAGAARWTCMMLTNNRLGEQMMHNFLNKYVAVCRRNGMQMADPIEPFVVDWRRTDLQTEIDAFMKDCTQQYKLEFVLCIQDNKHA
ncbi:hypothetical protein L596_016199 [Steinernema carpocapsae]|uniref:Protein argonaute Mid domain-containing protein n=1 Tax=Steinernema carpocapsae TaxID=34508 RepID=A0A4U5NHA5_STECR|nr:hypothetical protein L596_016199 [Steinernema carpocapsae]